MCLHNCTKRFIQSNTRISRGFAEYQVKKMNDAVKEQQNSSPPQDVQQTVPELQIQR